MKVQGRGMKKMIGSVRGLAVHERRNKMKKTRRSARASIPDGLNRIVEHSIRPGIVANLETIRTSCMYVLWPMYVSNYPNYPNKYYVCLELYIFIS